MIKKIRSPKFRDNAAPHGRLQVFAYRGANPFIDENGVRFDTSLTQIVETYLDKNLVVDDGRILINLIMAGESAVDPITYVETGTGGYTGVTDPNVRPPDPLGSDHALRIPLYQQTITSKERLNPMSTTYITLIEPGNSNGSITEFALKTLSGKLFARRTTRPMIKDADIGFLIRWTIQH